MEPNPTPPAPPGPVPEPPHAPGQVFSPSQPAPQQATTPLTAFDTSERPLGVAQPIQPIGGVVSGQNGDGGKSKKLRFPKRGPLLFFGIPLLLFGGSAAAYFGYYVPNKPENIWSKSLTNTGKGYDKLTQYTESQFGGKTKGIKLKGTFRVSGSLAADGSFEGNSDGDNGEFTASLSATGVKMNFDTRVIKSATSSPDIYFKVDGIKGIGTLFGAGTQYEQALNGIDGTWYFIDHTLFDQYAPGANSSLQISKDDVHSILRAIGDASKQNVFTSDPAKMAFTVKQNVGREKQDGRSVYHYKVAINKANLKAYVNSLCTNLKNSSLKKFFNDDGSTVSSTLGCDTADSSIAKFNTQRTADVWMDTRTKLIHKVRFTDPNNKDSYFDVGQDYQGGDVFPFSIGSQSKTGSDVTTTSLNLSLNMKTNTLSVTGSAKSTGTDSFNGSLEFTISPNATPVKVDKPVNPKTLIELLNDIGFGDMLGGGGVSGSVADTERKTDINALQGQIEAYNADTGYYPTLAQINDPAFRRVNFKGLDNAALQDPAGSAETLAAVPAAHVYSYQALPAGCNNTKVQCTDYTLTATLDAGGTYVKQSVYADTGPPTVLN